ncbi:PAS domain-containing protein [Rheinheimera sp. YQF-2]|uniref:histidine kinase n=1 Tax=Rheinheimera lutimaris TaxID=2740584 RepID=A0A7Y5AMP8_9GAMM|nr:ATP-binding protein [Rheinheimera lutimaris]NRQ41216.1 PAS domain-containing protein [Rheinheimera lutimaris]
MKAALPDNEQQRLHNLYQLEILDTAQEDAFDALTQLAAMICGVPISVISLIDKDRQWFKSRQGIDDVQTSRDIAFCAHTILQPEQILQVPDATKDYRFADNPQVLAPGGIRFYAGVPLVLDKGLALGTLCVVDTVCKTLTSAQVTALQLLARQASKLLEARKLTLDNQQKSALLLQSEQRYRSMLENLPGIVYRCQNDTDWNMLFISDEVAELTGFSAENFVSDRSVTFTQLTFEDDIPRLYHTVQQALAKQQGYDVQYRITSRNGEVKWLQELGRGIFTADGQLQYLDGFIWDITEQKTVEQLKNQFVSTVSHELRTPLTSISGSLGLVLGGVAGNLPDTAKQMLQIASDNCERLTHLINDLLDIEKLMAGKIQLNTSALHVHTLLEKCRQQNQPFADKHLCQLVLLPGPDLWLSADERRLEQVLTNLLSNAAKFSPANSRVEISVSQQRQLVEIAVLDQGPGIADSFKGKIFQKFSQADAADSRSKGGTGLGLAICKELMQAMRGDIDYENVAGGCRFYIRLPLAKAPTELK